jgi:predicted MFS family arabinose efflux permease
MKKTRFATLPVFVLICLLLAGLYLQKGGLKESFSLANEVPFANLSQVVRADDESYAVAFASNKRLARVAPDGALLYLLNAKHSPEKGFYFANQLSFDSEGSLYVASTYIDPDSLAVDRECIVKFSAEGHYQGVLFSKSYATDEYIDNIGLIRSLNWTPQGLRFCLAKDDQVGSFLIDAQTGKILSQQATPFADAQAQIIDATISDNGAKLAFSTAATEIYTATPGESPVRCYDGRLLPNQKFSIPSTLHFLGPYLYFSDLGQDGIMRLTGTNACKPVFERRIAQKQGFRDIFFECKNFQIDSPYLVLANNNKLIEMNLFQNQSRIKVLTHARANALLWLKRLLIWGQVALALVLAGLLIYRMLQTISPEGRQTTKQVIMVFLMVGTAVGLTMYMIFINMNRRLEGESKNNLRGYLEVGRMLVDGDAVDRVSHVRHYMNDDYQAILKQLNQTITRNGILETGTYSGVYKVFGNKLSALAYHDGLRGIFYPYDYDYGNSIYAEVAKTGTPYIGEMVDSYGVWLIGVAPLLNEQKDCVGFLEVGIDQSAQKEANRKLLLDTMVELAMVLFVLVFLFFELGFLSSHVFDNMGKTEAAARQKYDEGVLRFVSFLALTGVFMSATFLPLFSKSLAQPLGWLPFDMVIGLPMVVETLSGAVIAVLYGHLRHRAGIKCDVILGCLVVALGLFATSLASSFPVLFSCRVIVGMGMGLLMIALRTYFLIESDEEKKESGIIALTAGVVAGINAGSVFGGILAERIGMRQVFIAQSILLVVAAVVALLILRNRQRKFEPHVSGTVLSTRAFIRHRAVWGFFLLSFLPVTTCALFLGFLFPLFAEGKGCSINQISMAFMLFGLCSVYLGPSLTRLTTAWFGTRRSLVVGAGVMVAGLLLFAYFQTVAIAYITVILFGLTDSFIFNQGISYFSSLSSVRHFGEDKAMGIYNVFESGGEALGPLAFGLAMSLGLGAGISAIAGALGLCSLLFISTCDNKKD